MTIPLSQLPALNAFLNATSALFLLAGFLFIKKKYVRAHRTTMALALVTSTAFLTSYLYYHAHVGSKHFTGEGWIRPVYFSILISHTILAVVIVPLIFIALFWALRQRFDKHRAVARWAWPLWMYVSVTGVIIYLLLYGRPAI